MDGLKYESLEYKVIIIFFCKRDYGIFWVNNCI